MIATSPTMNRRKFLGNSTLATAGLTILPGGLRAAPANNKLNIALIGVHGRAQALYDSIATENVVALCDVNEAFFPEVLERFPGAKTYNDWRKCLEQKDIDAVVICTPDHQHAFISNWALNRDLHVYCEKPLAISVEEARVVREKWLTKKGKLATQVGMQRHADPNFQRTRIVLPYGSGADLSYYAPRKKEDQLPPVGHFQKQWIDACKDPLRPTACDFEYSANMIELLLLGLVAYRAGGKLDYDPATGKVANLPAANEFISRKYRSGWALNG